MQLRRILLKTIVIFSLVGLVACSDDDNESTNNQPESDVTSADTDDEGTPDVTDNEDTTDQEDATEADAEGDTEQEDGDIVEATCETGSDARVALARETVGQNEGVNAGEVTFTTEDDATIAIIDAASGGTAQMATESYIYLDVDTNEKLEISDADAFENADWDIAIKRTMIRINSKDSGPGGWMVARVDAGWDAAAPPESTDSAWKMDNFIADDCELVVEGQGTISTGFGIWYDYDMSTHTFTVPEDTTWILYNMQSHTVLKLEVQSLEDMIYTVRYAPFAAPE